MLLRPGRPLRAPVRVRTPGREGAWTLEVAGPGWHASAPLETAVLVEAEGPVQVQWEFARLTPAPLAPPLVVRGRLRSLGRGVLGAGRVHAPGETRIHYRQRDARGQVVGTPDRRPLRRDLYPGQV